MNIYIIGCGGVGSWLAPALCLLRKPENVTLLDGDRLEKKNLNRQLFSADQIGQNKARALAEKYGCRHAPNYFSVGSLTLDRSDVLVVCADNNPARLAAFTEADREGSTVIVAANEKHSAEAYIYRPGWKMSDLDPRVYYPQLLTDHSGDPMAAAIGCTGEAQIQSPQLVTSNAMAAALAGHLFVLWINEAPKLDREILPRLPHKLVANLSRLESLSAAQINHANEKDKQ